MTAKKKFIGLGSVATLGDAEVLSDILPGQDPAIEPAAGDRALARRDDAPVPEMEPHSNDASEP